MLRARVHGMPLALAIALALALKAALLFGLWYAFFAAPQAHHMRMPTAQVEQQVLGTASPPLSSPSPSSQPTSSLPLSSPSLASQATP